jgi:hypothetical protein
MTDPIRKEFQDDWAAVHKAYMSINPQTGRSYVQLNDAAAIATWVLRWKETSNESFLDVALQYCDSKDVPILNELRLYLAEAARLRNPPESSTANKEGHKDHALLLMVQLVFVEATLSEAAGKASAWMSDMGKPMKASTLEKQYTASMRSGNSPREKVFFDHWLAYPDAEFHRNLVEMRRLMRGPTDNERGNRRE